MTDEPERDEERRHRRGLKFRRREDHAVELFQEALAKLDRPERVARILLELGRFYNPSANAAIVDPVSRRDVLESLARGETDRARSMLEARLESYIGRSS